MSNSKNKLSSKGLEKIFGKNIANLVNDIETNNTIKKEYSNVIMINLIHNNPYQPRKIFSEENINELANSIKQYGIIQPILIRESINGYDLIAGERRLRASKALGLKEIPAIILAISEQEMHEYAIIENVQRVNLNVMEEAQAYDKLINKFSLTQDELSNKIGKSRSYISSVIRLLTLPNDIQNYLLNNQLSLGHVKPLLFLSKDKKSISKIAKQAVEQKWNVRKMENYLSKVKQNSNPSRNQVSKKETVNLFLENKISEKLDARVIIKNKYMTIKYNSVKDLNRILEILHLIEK